VLYSAVPFDAAAAGMLTVEEARERLSATEPLDSLRFFLGDPGIDITYGKGWYEGKLANDPVPAWLTLPDGTRVQLTFQAAQQIGSTAKANKQFQKFVPTATMEDIVRFAFREGLGDKTELKLLISDKPGEDESGGEVPLAVAQTRATVTPFSNVTLLETVLQAVRDKLGSEAADSAVVDYKMWSDLEHASFRVVLPAVQSLMTGTGTDDDAWCYGLSVSNSPIGLKQTMVDGYLFRFTCTNGAMDIRHSAGGFQRRGSTPDAAYRWAGETAVIILGDLETAFAQVQELTRHQVDDDPSLVLAQLFRENSVPKDQQLRIAEALEQAATQQTMYDLMQTVTQAANLPGLGWRPAVALMSLGGHLAEHGGGMCDGSLPEGCRRLLPEDWAEQSAN
jgi:hypothetical protein